MSTLLRLLIFKNIMLFEYARTLNKMESCAQINKVSLEKAWSRILNKKSTYTTANTYNLTSKKSTPEPLSSAKRRSRKERVNKISAKPYFSTKEKQMIQSIQEYNALLSKSATLIQRNWRTWKSTKYIY
jgi:hypothetical protein